MTHKEYNGWYNYETWATALWIDSDAGSQNYWRETATEILHRSKAERSFSKVERATLTLADELKVQIEEGAPDLGASMYADLLGAALSEVNWQEIAENLIRGLDNPRSRFTRSRFGRSRFTRRAGPGSRRAAPRFVRFVRRRH